MRKGTTSLLLAAFVGAACMLAWNGLARAVPVEPTDSGAPSAIVIFPVSEKPDTAPAGLPPVAFNHYIHEKWMAKAGKDCIVCHHTGDPVACTNCHTVEGTPESKGVTLERAMHALDIAQRSENTPSSCVSCHARQLAQPDCAGCHGQLVRGARDDKWCGVCHQISPAMTKEQFALGVVNKLPANQNEKLAVATEKARVPAKYWSPAMGPYKSDINTLVNKYEAVKFNHRAHMTVLLERINGNQLAGAFHTEPATLCVTCHHNSPATLTPSKCVNCHSPAIQTEDPGRPRLMAAFHLQCMNCHTDMKVARPRNTDCDNCHKPRPVQGAAK